MSSRAKCSTVSSCGTQSKDPEEAGFNTTFQPFQPGLVHVRHCPPIAAALGRFPKPQPQFRRNLAMTRQAQRPQIIQIALPATLRHRLDMIRVPQRPPRRNRLHPIQRKPRHPGRPASPLQRVVDRHSIRLAKIANTAIPRKHLIPQVARIGPEPPLVDAIVGAKRAPPLSQNLQLAPPA